MREVTVELRKYPGRPSRTASTVLLGTDDHGVWLGHAEHRIVYLIPHEGWWKARHFPDGGWKVDITTPPEWDGDRVVLEDLALDVGKLHGRVWIEDEDEFSTYVSTSVYPSAVAAEARRTCDAIAGAMFAEPFLTTGDRWLGEIPSRWDAALLLDMGGVLSCHESDAATRAWEARLGLEAGGLAAALRTAIGPGWEGGRRLEEIDRIACDTLGIDAATLFQLRVDVMCDGELDRHLLGIIQSLPTTTASAVLSNNGAGVRTIWEAAYDIGNVVDAVFVSGEERIAKPDPRFYDIARWRLGVQPQRCVFVDDQPANVDAAHAAGMVGMHYSHNEDGDDLYARINTALFNVRQ